MNPSSSNMLKIALVLFMTLNVLLMIRLKKVSGSTGGHTASEAAGMEILLNNIYFTSESEGAVINGNLTLEAENGEFFSLAEIIIGKKLLFLRYSDLHCNLCVDHNLDYLKSLSDSIGGENIVILASYRSLRDLILFKRVNQLPFPVYRIPEEGIGIPADRYGVPYLFITNPGLIARHVHIPDKELPQLKRILLSVIPAHYRNMK